MALFPLAAVGAAGAVALWIRQMTKHDFDPMKATEAFLKDVSPDSIRNASGSLYRIFETVFQLPTHIESSADFIKQVKTLSWCASKLDELSPEGADAIDAMRCRVYLEERLQGIVRQYAVILLSKEKTGTATEKLRQTYTGLYLLGRAGTTLTSEQSEIVVNGLIAGHKSRRKTKDAELHEKLQRLSSAALPELIALLANHPAVTKTGLNPAVIAYTLTGYKDPRFTNPPLIGEMTTFADSITI